MTSTNGRNIPDVCHFKSLAPMTVMITNTQVNNIVTSNVTFFFLNSNRPLTVTFRSPFLGWVYSSIWRETSPMGLSTPDPVSVQNHAVSSHPGNIFTQNKYRLRGWGWACPHELHNTFKLTSERGRCVGKRLDSWQMTSRRPTPAGLYFFIWGKPNTLPIVHWHRGSTGDKKKTAATYQHGLASHKNRQVSTENSRLGG